MGSIKIKSAARVITRKSYQTAAMLTRKLLRKDAKLLRTHMQSEVETKLHLGCGFHPIEGWLNSDLKNLNEVFHLDAGKTFPIQTNTFLFVYSEHMIEHLHFNTAQGMLREIFRVLKPGGVVRIATPDLRFLVDLYSDEKSSIQKDYIKWSVSNYIPYATAESDAFVINNFVRDWGHKFIYDEVTLRSCMEDSGFEDIKRCGIGLSNHVALQKLENESRMPARFLALESLIIEARKPCKKGA